MSLDVAGCDSGVRASVVSGQSKCGVAPKRMIRGSRLSPGPWPVPGVPETHAASGRSHGHGRPSFL